MSDSAKSSVVIKVGSTETGINGDPTSFKIGGSKTNPFVQVTSRDGRVNAHVSTGMLNEASPQVNGDITYKAVHIANLTLSPEAAGTLQKDFANGERHLVEEVEITGPKGELLKLSKALVVPCSAGSNQVDVYAYEEEESGKWPSSQKVDFKDDDEKAAEIEVCGDAASGYGGYGGF